MKKIVTGLLLAVAGIVGIVFGRNIKQRVSRISILLLSGACLGSGFYLLIDGVDDFVIGQADRYVIGGPMFQGIISKSKEDYENELKAVFKHEPKIRRLHYKCHDGSEDFTVFSTGVGVFGVPDKSIICKDGFKLLIYTNG